jgi:hypothetical protein
MSPDKHPNAHELISAYLDGELHDDELARVKTWIASNPQYSQLLTDLRLISAQIQELPQQTPAEDLTGRILRQAERTVLQPATDLNASYIPDSGPGRRERGLLRGVLWGAAAIAAALLLSVFLPRDSDKLVSLPSTVNSDFAEADPQQPLVLERETAAGSSDLNVDSKKDVASDNRSESPAAKMATSEPQSGRQFDRKLVADSAISWELMNVRGQAREVYEVESNQLGATEESFPGDKRSPRRRLAASPNVKAPNDKPVVQAFNKALSEDLSLARSDQTLNDSNAWNWVATLRLSTEHVRLKTLEHSFARHAIDFDGHLLPTPAAPDSPNPPGASAAVNTLGSKNGRLVDAQGAQKYILVQARRDQIFSLLNDLQDHLGNVSTPGLGSAQKEGHSSKIPHSPSDHTVPDEMISVLFVVQIGTANKTNPEPGLPVDANSKTDLP